MHIKKKKKKIIRLEKRILSIAIIRVGGENTSFDIRDINELLKRLLRCTNAKEKKYAPTV